MVPNLRNGLLESACVGLSCHIAFRSYQAFAKCKRVKHIHNTIESSMTNNMNGVQDLVKLSAISRIQPSNMSSPYEMIWHFIFIFLVNILDDVAKGLFKCTEHVSASLSNLMSSKVNTTITTICDDKHDLVSNSIMIDKRHCINVVYMTRIYKTNESNSANATTSAEHNEMNRIVDAVLAYVANLNNIPTLRLNPNGQFMVSYKDKPFQINANVFMKIDSYDVDVNTGCANSIKIALMSNELSAAEISHCVLRIYEAHKEELKNSLGNNIYFFDHKIKDLPRPPAMMQQAEQDFKRMLIQSSPKNISFTMTPFYSNKKFSNIFGTDVRKIQHRLEFFLNNKSWYDEKGIPYQLGMMLSGKPGTGKTSIIRAIANMTKRHIVNVNFSNITTTSQLKNLFFNEKLVVYTDSTMTETKTFHIPIEQRLYVLEEIDAIGDILKQRTEDKDMGNVIPDELTLGEILTVLDGTMEVPGRIIVMTSNHPEHLDKALMRPGRVDVRAFFGNATRELIIEMFEAYVEIPFPRRKYESVLPHEVLTPAEVGEVIMKFCKVDRVDVEEVIGELCEAARVKQRQCDNEQRVVESSDCFHNDSVNNDCVDSDCVNNDSNENDSDSQHDEAAVNTTFTHGLPLTEAQLNLQLTHVTKMTRLIFTPSELHNIDVKTYNILKSSKDSLQQWKLAFINFDSCVQSLFSISKFPKTIRIVGRTMIMTLYETTYPSLLMREVTSAREIIELLDKRYSTANDDSLYADISKFKDCRLYMILSAITSRENFNTSFFKDCTLTAFNDDKFSITNNTNGGLSFDYLDVDEYKDNVGL